MILQLLYSFMRFQKPHPIYFYFLTNTSHTRRMDFRFELDLWRLFITHGHDRDLWERYFFDLSDNNFILMVSPFELGPTEVDFLKFGFEVKSYKFCPLDCSASGKVDVYSQFPNQAWRKKWAMFKRCSEKCTMINLTACSRERREQVFMFYQRFGWQKSLLIWPCEMTSPLGIFAFVKSYIESTLMLRSLKNGNSNQGHCLKKNPH